MRIWLETSKPTKVASRRPSPVPTVLLVEDDAETRESLRLLLCDRLPEARIVTAPTAAAGLESLRLVKPDVIVSDFRMPGMDGIEFLRACRDVAPKAARVMITAYADPELVSKAIYDVDVALIMAKPVDPYELVEVVRAVLNGASPNGVESTS